ncbi:hypothetical protein ACT7DA_04620 [Bacillus pacificus]
MMKSPRWALFTFAVLLNVNGPLGFTSIVIGHLVFVVVVVDRWSSRVGLRSIRNGCDVCNLLY